MTFRALILAALLLAAGSANADPAVMRRYVDRPASIEAIAAVIRAQVAGRCVPRQPIDRRLATTNPVMLGPDGVPISGTWRETWVVPGCGGSRVFNVLATARGAGRVDLAALLPGTTRAEPVVQASAATLVSRTLDCRTAVVVDTAFAGFDPSPVTGVVAPRRDPRAWTETWTAQGCDTTALVPVRFEPGADGAVSVLVGTPRLGR